MRSTRNLRGTVVRALTPARPPSSRCRPGLARGEHTFAVRAIDKAGNVDTTPATHAWTIAAAVVPPVPTATPTPAPTVAPTPAPTPPPAVTPPGPADLAAGLAKLPGTARSKDGRSFSFTLPAGALPAGTVVTVKLTGAGLGTAGVGRASVRAGTATRVIVKLSAKARKALKKKRKLKLKLTATATEAGGNRATKSKALTLKARRQR